MNNIIHLQIIKDNDFRYVCNQAVITKPSKRTNDNLKVTCHNCLRLINKEQGK